MHTPDQIYRLERHYRDDYVVFESSPVDADGHRLKLHDCDVAFGTLAYDDDRPVPDAWLSGRLLLVSKQVRDLAQNFRLPPTLRWVPVQLSNRGEASGKYSVPMVEVPYSVLDLERSPHIFYPTTPPLLWKVEKWVLDGKSLTDADLFQADRHEWFVTPPLYEELVRLGLVGLKFLPCEVAW